MAVRMDIAEEAMLFDPLVQDSEEPVDYSSKDRAIVQEGRQLYCSIGHITHVVIMFVPSTTYLIVCSSIR